MFLPENQDALQEAEKLRKKGFKDIEAWCLEIIPEALRGQASVSVQEVQCGDPDCAPIDTAVTIVFDSGANGMLGLPMEAREVTKEELERNFPTNEVLEAWHMGDMVEWPPVDGPEELPQLRFELGTKVECRIGPDAETDWGPGTVIELWYRESSWPPGSFAPYKIKLDDGRDIFAPGDMDQVIRKRQ